MLEIVNLLGAGLTVMIYLLCILVFVARLIKRPEMGQKFGVILLITAFPLGYLLFSAPRFERPALYYVQVSLMLLYLAVMLVLDYWLKFDFRQTRWMVISYVTLFFAATGGMLGMAAYAGRGWILVSVLLFFMMAVLAFIQRAVTGY